MYLRPLPVHQQLHRVTWPAGRRQSHPHTRLTTTWRVSDVAVKDGWQYWSGGGVWWCVVVWWVSQGRVAGLSSRHTSRHTMKLLNTRLPGWCPISRPLFPCLVCCVLVCQWTSSSSLCIQGVTCHASQGRGYNTLSSVLRNTLTLHFHCFKRLLFKWHKFLSVFLWF